MAPFDDDFYVALPIGKSLTDPLRLGNMTTDSTRVADRIDVVLASLYTDTISGWIVPLQPNSILGLLSFLTYATLAGLRALEKNPSVLDPPGYKLGAYEVSVFADITHHFELVCILDKGIVSWHLEDNVYLKDEIITLPTDKYEPGRYRMYVGSIDAKAIRYLIAVHKWLNKIQVEGVNLRIVDNCLEIASAEGPPELEV